MDRVPEEVRAYIARAVKEGFLSEEDIVETATEFALEETGLDDQEAAIARITAQLISVHRRVQARWKTPTDCDKLDTAFARLERRGVVSRQNFTCCSTCGHHEIWDEIREAKGRGKVSGYVFYHMQDTEGACEGGSLYLKYGAVAEGEAAVAEIGRAVVEELEVVGLKAEWNGRPDTAVQVVGLKWKRRR